MDILFDKAKGLYRQDIRDTKYIDLSSPLNVFGHSPARLTPVVKNGLSASWNIDKDSIYHDRFERLLRSEISGDYKVYYTSSFKEVILSMAAAGYGLSGSSRHMESYIHSIRLKQTEADVNLIDYTDLYINGTDSSDHDLHGTISVGVYYYYPELITAIPDLCDAVILPALYSGAFGHCVVLVRNGTRHTDLHKLFSTSIPALNLISAIRLYHLIKSHEISTVKPDIETKLFTGRGRVFTFKETSDPDKIRMAADQLKDNHKIIINSGSPFYSYFPINIEKTILEKCIDILKNFN